MTVSYRKIFRVHTYVPTTHALWVNTTALKCTVLRPVTLIEKTKTGFDFDKGIINPTFSHFYKDQEKDY